MTKPKRFGPLQGRTKAGRPHPLRPLPGAFTLIELLVVIAIIALLMSIMVPALDHAKKQARLAMDLSNLHQWGLVWKVFTDDNDGYFAVGSAAGGDRMDWLDQVVPYLKDERLLFCPEAKKRRALGGRNPFAAWTETEDSGYTYTGSYGINYFVAKEYSAGTTNATDASGRTLRWQSPNVKRAGYVPMLVGSSMGGAAPHHVDDPPLYDGQDWGAGLGDLHEMRRFCMNRHNGYVSGVLMDYSARKIGLKELWVLRWSRHWFRRSDTNLTPDYSPPIWPEWMTQFRDY